MKIESFHYLDGVERMGAHPTKTMELPEYYGDEYADEVSRLRELLNSGREFKDDIAYLSERDLKNLENNFFTPFSQLGELASCDQELSATYFDKLDEGDETGVYTAAANAMVLRLAVDMRANSVFDRIQRYKEGARSDLVTSLIDSTEDLRSFYPLSRIRSGGTSLFEILNTRRRDGEFYRSFISYYMNVLKVGNPLVDVWERQKATYSKYPSLFAYSGENLPMTLVSLSMSNRDDFREKDVDAQMATFQGDARRIVSKFHSIRKNLARIVKDPRNKELDDVSELILQFLSNGAHEKDTMLDLLVSDDDELQELYLCASSFRAHKEYGAFYTRLADTLYETIATTDNTHLLTKNDADEFVQDGQDDRDSLYTVEDLSQTHKKFFSQKGTRHSTIFQSENGLFQSGGGFEMVTDGHNQNACTFLIYLRRYDKAIHVRADFKKNKIAWNFLESPEELSEYSATVIDFITRQVHEASGTGEHSNFVSTQNNGDDSIPRERMIGHSSISKKYMKRLLAASEDSFSPEDAEDSQGLQRRIIIPDESIFGNIPQGDISRIIDKIYQFNEGQVGRILKLKRTNGHAEDQLFRFRVGGYRLILRMTEDSPNGVIAFEAIDVGSRKEIYRRNNLD